VAPLTLELVRRTLVLLIRVARWILGARKREVVALVLFVADSETATVEVVVFGIKTVVVV
jgi:hypothetical protein